MSTKIELDYRIITRVDGDCIHQEVQSLHEGAYETLSRRVMDTTDEATRRALIALGWTPPATSANQRDAAPAPAEHQTRPR